MREQDSLQTDAKFPDTEFAVQVLFPKLVLNRCAND